MESQIEGLIHDLQYGDSEKAVRAGYELGRLGNSALEPVLMAVGDQGMLQRLRLLKANGQWHESDAGFLMLELTKRVLRQRGLG